MYFYACQQHIGLVYNMKDSNVIFMLCITFNKDLSVHATEK